MVRGERSYAVHRGDGLGDLLVPLGRVDEEAVPIEGQVLKPGGASGWGGGLCMGGSPG